MANIGIMDSIINGNGLLYISFPEEILQSNDYKVYDLKPEENLMDVSYRFYNTIDLWWVIFYFNDFNFSMVINKINNVQPFLNYMRSILTHTNVVAIGDEEMDEVKEIIRNYYTGKGYSITESIKLTDTFLTTPTEQVVSDTLSIMETELYQLPYIDTKIKIPGMDLVYRMNSYLRNLNDQ